MTNCLDRPYWHVSRNKYLIVDASQVNLNYVSTYTTEIRMGCHMLLGMK
jgi:hypothetical protein